MMTRICDDCGRLIRTDGKVWIDETGGDCCPVTNEGHAPAVCAWCQAHDVALTVGVQGDDDGLFHLCDDCKELYLEHQQEGGARDSAALDRLAELLNGREWEVADLETVAEIVRSTGREIGFDEEEDDEDDEDAGMSTYGGAEGLIR